MGDQGWLADAEGHQYAHLLTSVVHPQQEHEAEDYHCRNGHADQSAAHHGAHTSGGIQHARRILVIARDLVVVPIHRKLLRRFHGFLHVDTPVQNESGILVYFLADLVLVQSTCSVQIGVHSVGGEFRAAGHLPVAVPFEYSDDGGFDSCRRMRLIVGIIWIGLEREGIADFKPIGFGEILMDHRHMLIGRL